MPSVLVTRPRPAADEFAAQLRGAGFHVYLAPLMEYVPLGLEMPDLADYQALVFSSAEGARVFAGRSPERGLPVLAVGDATAEAARQMGFGKVYSARGDSEDVISLIRAEAPGLNLKKILHPCSEDTPADIGAATEKFGVMVVRLPVYKAQLLDSFPEDVATALQHGAVDAVALFSARTATHFTRLIEQRGLRGACTKMTAVCISGRVTEAANGLPWHAVRTAKHPHLEAMLDALKGSKKMTAEERRQRPERRTRDIAYAGADRRTGKDRRAHERRQQQRVLQEKIRFINRSMLTAAFMFIAIVLAGVFLMAPEYARLKERADIADQLEKQPPPENTPAASALSLGGALNSGIEKLRAATDSAATAIADRSPQAFSQIFDNVALLRRTPAGEAAVAQSLKTLRDLLAASPGKPEKIGQAIHVARQRDKTLDAALGSVGGKDLAAAALLLTLNEFRSNVSAHRPYADDLALLQKFSGNDPAMNRALQRLSPYAERGVMSRESLQTEFKGLAADIVTAKMTGQDVSVKQQALARFERLRKAGQADGIRGQSSDAVVARAQLLLDKGDVPGAMRELQTLDGAAAATAAPWMDNAAGNVLAAGAADDLTQGLLQELSGSTGFSVADVFSSLKEKLTGPDTPYLSPALREEHGGGADVLAPP